ncbi:MAG: lipopolysaccharide biosynthesis protein [Planctomycetes bacterium]|nr:lipopolysaccharide biosynthesis protein [Planctomycetota bacterium]
MLPKEVFGLIAAVQVVVGFADYFKDSGLGQAIVRRKQLETGFLSTVFYTNLILGAFISMVIWGMASPLALWLKDPEIESILPILGLSVFITSTGLVQRNIYVRMLRFDRLAFASMLNAIVYGVSAITMAFMGMGIWAMVYGTLLGHLAGNGVLWIKTDWWPRWTYNWRIVKELWLFCVGILGSNLSGHFLSNVDRIVVQVVLGTNALASYVIAARLVTFPAQNLGRVLSSVLLPAFSSLQDDLDSYRQNFIRACAGIALLTCPMMAGLMAVAPVLVSSLIPNPEWQDAIPLIVWMGPLGVVLAISLPLHAIYVSLGKSGELFCYGLLFGVISVEAYLIGSTYGVVGVAIAGSVTHTIMAYFYFAVPFKFIHLKVRTLVVALSPYFVASTAMGLLVWMLRVWLEGMGLDVRLNLGLSVLLGVLVYGTLMLALKAPALLDLMRVVGMRRATPSTSEEAAS